MPAQPGVSITAEQADRMVAWALAHSPAPPPTPEQKARIWRRVQVGTRRKTMATVIDGVTIGAVIILIAVAVWHLVERRGRR